MARAVLLDKVGRSETIPVEPGDRISDVLRANGIAANSILTWVNGKIVPELGSVVRPEDYIEFRQVRHYDMGVIRTPPTRLYSDIEPVYAKAVLFDEAGSVEHRVEQVGPDRFVRFVEDTFVQSILRYSVWLDDEEVTVGLSGGRDSVSFLTLLERTRDRLPRVRLTAVTVVGLPDWEEPATFQAALSACERLGAEQVIVTAEDIAGIFQLNRPFVEFMSRVVAKHEHPLVMVATHQVMRRMIEIEAHRRNCGTVALGLNADDLVASLITWFTSGYPMGGIPIRKVGDFKYIYPLYGITKKELTLYLELVAPDLNRQGAPGRFTTGPGERSLAYAITDQLYDLWPGIDHYLFDAYNRIQAQLMPTFEGTCSVCGASILKFGDDITSDSTTCDVCLLFRRTETDLADPA